MMETTILGVAGAMVSCWIASIEWRLRSMHEMQRKHINRREAEELIDIKLESIKVTQEDIKDDIRVLNKKIDKLLDAMLHK